MSLNQSERHGKMQQHCFWNVYKDFFITFKKVHFLVFLICVRQFSGPLLPDRRHYLPANSPIRKNKQITQAMINFLFALFELCIADVVMPSSLPYLEQGPLFVSVVDISLLGRHMLTRPSWMVWSWWWPRWLFVSSGVFSSSVITADGEVDMVWLKCSQNVTPKNLVFTYRMSVRWNWQLKEVH